MPKVLKSKYMLLPFTNLLWTSCHNLNLNHNYIVWFFFTSQIVAMEALVRYSYNSRIKDITDLNVEIDIPDSNKTETFHITGENIATLQQIKIPNVWGHINIVATGAGQAIAQLVRF